MSSPSPLSTPKSERHSKLLSDVSQILITSDDFLKEAVPAVAKQLAEELHAQCVCVFFRRKDNKDLVRYALAINQGDVAKDYQNDESFEFDKKYERVSKTLLYEAYNKGKTWNCDTPEIESESFDQYRGIIQDFNNAKPRILFRHLIILPIFINKKQFIGEKQVVRKNQLGAIRIINHLNAERNFAFSDSPFSKAQDEVVVRSIGAMLALAFANHRKREKLYALKLAADDFRQAKTEDDAIIACLRALTSEETGFPRAMWREIESDGASRVTVPYPDRGDLDPVGLPAVAPPASEKHDPYPKDYSVTDKRFLYPEWAIRHHLGASCTFEASYFGRRRELTVYAETTDEFDDLSKYFIGINVELLRNTLARLHTAKKETGIVGSSTAILKALKRVEAAAQVKLPVLILGETGTGKEVFAKAIHNLGDRGDELFIPLNCAALSETLLESELFGHEKGAFTGADRQRIGWFETADRGTLFLDEIGDMPANLQAKLLRVLEDKKVIRVGGKEQIPVDIRVIAATHHDLAKDVEAGRFRRDLYGRLNGLRFELPPLRERKEDIAALAYHFLETSANIGKKKIHQIDPAAIDALGKYSWPENLRELRNRIEEAAVQAQTNTITLDDLNEVIRDVPVAPQPPSEWVKTLEEVELEHYRFVIERTAGREKAATALDVNPGTVTTKKSKLGVEYGAALVGKTPYQGTLRPLMDVLREHVEFVLQRTGNNKTKAAIHLGIDRGAIDTYLPPGS